MVACVFVGHGEDDEGGSFRSVGDETFGAIEDIIFARSIGTSFGFRQAERTQLPSGKQIGQIFHFLFFCAKGVDWIAAKERVGTDDDRSSAAVLSEFLHTAHRQGYRRRCRYISLGKGYVVFQAFPFSQPFAFFHVDFLCKRLNLVFCELALHFAEHLMFITQNEIHTHFSFSFFGGSGYGIDLYSSSGCFPVPWWFPLPLLSKNCNRRSILFLNIEK